MDEIVESQDQKLQEVKRSVFNGISIPLRLTAEAPVLLSTISELPSPALMVSTHYNDNNDNRQLTIQEGGAPESFFADSAHTVGDADIDFSKPENLFLLEAPIDARKDHNMLKLACTIPKRTFMSRLLRSYPVNRKRLAFIQRRPSTLKSMELLGNLIVKGGHTRFKHTRPVSGHTHFWEGLGYTSKLDLKKKCFVPTVRILGVWSPHLCAHP